MQVVKYFVDKFLGSTEDIRIIKLDNETFEIEYSVRNNVTCTARTFYSLEEALETLKKHRPQATEITKESIEGLREILKQINTLALEELRNCCEAFGEPFSLESNMCSKEIKEIIRLTENFGDNT